MNRDEYLAAMQAFPCGNPLPLDQIPAEWFAAAWEIERVREEQTAEIARTVRKIGCLHYTPTFLGLLARSLSGPRLVELFRAIRDRSLRELEFRADFERAFPSVVSDLPPPAVQRYDREALRQSLYSAIGARDLERVGLVLRCLRERGVPVESVQFTEYEARAEFTPEEWEAMTEADVERYLALLESPPPSTRMVSAAGYAEILGARDIAAVLRAARATEAEQGAALGTGR
jgi:hypothetical protein